MNRRAFLSTALLFTLTPVLFASDSKDAFQPNLAGLVEGKGWLVRNRTISSVDFGAAKGVHFDERPGQGVALVENYELANGSIEFDVKGKNVLQQSFVGVAFHALDDTTFDAIYFRPFNFKAQDPERRSHAVQYIAQPTYTWQKLRTEHPGVYEQGINPPPEPDGWFHARVVIDNQTASVFVNTAKEPSLRVQLLNTRKTGRIGLWVGEGSGGDFANLRVVPAK